MSASPCTLLSNGCYDCVAVPAIPFRPRGVIYSNNEGWNSNAESIVRHSGDCVLKFGVGQSIGILCGVSHADEGDNISDMSHGFVIKEGAASKQFAIYERGQQRTSFTVFPTTAEFQLYRRSRVVTYAVPDIGFIYKSQVESSGEIKAVGWLYLAGDTII